MADVQGNYISQYLSARDLPDGSSGGYVQAILRYNPTTGAIEDRAEDGPALQIVNTTGSSVRIAFGGFEQTIGTQGMTRTAQQMRQLGIRTRDDVPSSSISFV